METETILLPTLPSMELFAQRVVKGLLARGAGDRAYVITLSGDLGAGKTTFVQSVAKVLGVTATVQSPTFVLMKSYQTTVAWPKRIVHIDAYRLEGPLALRPLGWERETQEKNTVIFLEWPECVAPLAQVPDLNITFSVTENGGRKAILSTS